jgi:LmbE family N-acetylglucosaminyl deacetylase
MGQKLSILGVNAHPHDWTWYAGTLGVAVAAGDSVTVVSVTTGESAHNEALHDELMKPEAERDPAIVNQKPADFSALKAKEMEEAAAVFGITDVRNLGFPMPFKVAQYPESVQALREVILDVRPDIMITQSPFLTGHQGKASGSTDDHYETAYMSIEARGRAANPSFGDTEAPHAIATTYYPGVYFQKEEIDFVVDITDFFEQRIAAEDKYLSQGHYPAWSRRRMELDLGGVGWGAGTMYGEAFVREKPELVTRMTAPASDLRRASESIGDYYERIVGERPPAH